MVTNLANENSKLVLARLPEKTNLAKLLTEKIGPNDAENGAQNRALFHTKVLDAGAQSNTSIAIFLEVEQ